jgi:hypothetical protein
LCVLRRPVDFFSSSFVLLPFLTPVCLWSRVPGMPHRRVRYHLDFLEFPGDQKERKKKEKRKKKERKKKG